MAKITKAELENRVAQVTDLLLKGATREIILQYASNPRQNWQVSDRMIDNYMAKAREKIESSGAFDRDFEIAKSNARFEYLYMQSVGGKDFKTARAVEVDRGKLLGLPAPTRTDITSGGKEVNPYMSMPKDELLALMRKKLAEDE